MRKPMMFIHHNTDMCWQNIMGSHDILPKFGKNINGYV